jgi:hypothetical protein
MYVEAVASALPPLLQSSLGLTNVHVDAEDDAPHVRLLRLAFWSPQGSEAQYVELTVWQRAYSVLGAFYVGFGTGLVDEAVGADGAAGYSWLSGTAVGYSWHDVLRLALLAKHARRALTNFVATSQRNSSYCPSKDEARVLVRLLSIASVASEHAKATHFSVASTNMLVTARQYLVRASAETAAAIGGGLTATESCPICGDDLTSANLLRASCRTCCVSFDKDLFSTRAHDLDCRGLLLCSMCPYSFVPTQQQYSWMPIDLAAPYCHLCRAAVLPSR